LYNRRIFKKRGKTSLKDIQVLIPLLSLITALIFGLLQLFNISQSFEKSAKLETYKLIEQLLNDSYPTIEKFRSADKFDTSTSLSTANELESFLSQLNTCVEVGACDRTVSQAFLCNSPKISGPLSYSSGIASMSLSVEKSIMSSGMPTLKKTFLSESIPHLRVMETLSRIFGNTGKWKSYELIIDGCRQE
jgi:hypothetical protein